MKDFCTGLLQTREKELYFYLEQNTFSPLDMSKINRYNLTTYFNKVIKDNKMPETKFMNKMKIYYT